MKRKALGGVIGLGVGLSAGLLVFGWGGPSCAAPEVKSDAQASTGAEFSGLDAKRRRIGVALQPVVEGIGSPTDIQAVPGHPELLVVLEKDGVARWVDLKTNAVGEWFRLKVNTRSEQGLLGIAFHPKYAQNGRIFVHYSLDVGGQMTGRIAEFKAPTDPRKGGIEGEKVVLEVAQPWPNHDAGQIAFGPDGMLYIGFGDGGAADDPKGHGQNRRTLLGSMLRVDVSAAPYAIPKDNPFVGQPDVRPEIWAYGLRNPWRFSFAPDGRLIVADVGQNRYEEITIVGRGENHGWKVREADRCFEPETGCATAGMVDPVYTYTHRDDGISVTGGYVYTGKDVPALKGKYVFADFGTGRIWAIDLPKTGAVAPKDAYALGKWDLLPSTFGVGADGALYVGDYRRGRIFKVVAGR